MSTTRSASLLAATLAAPLFLLAQVRTASPPPAADSAASALAAAAAGAPAPTTVPTTQALPSVADLVDRVKGAVVNVEVTSTARAGEGPHDERMEELLERFFGDRPGGVPEELREEMQPRIRRGNGSGVIIDGAGRTLTNNHVVEGATRIRVTLADGRELDARVLGTDSLTDLALIQIQSPPKDLTFVPLGDSDAARIGEPVIAIGNPFGLSSSVSLGILSGRAREIAAGPYDDFLQTDAAINPGNSGGPLFNARGEVIGVNTAIAGLGTGVGFAIPSNMAKQLVPQLAKGEEIERGWLGVAIQDLDPDVATSLGIEEDDGAIVSDVTQGTPAAEAGLQPYDLIVRVNEEEIDSARDLTRTIGFTAPGRQVTLHVLRKGKRVAVPLKLGKRPDLENVRPVRGEDRENGRPDDEAAAGIGLRLQDARPGLRGMPRLPEGVRGAVVAEVTPGSPADEAGLRPGMVILDADGMPLEGASALTKRLRAAEPGSVVTLRVQVGEHRTLVPLRVPSEKEPQ